MFQTTEFTNRQTDKEKHHSSYLGILHPRVDKKKDNSTKKVHEIGGKPSTSYSTSYPRSRMS